MGDHNTYNKVVKKNILVLGAGALQIPLINRVKEKGYNPVVVSLHSDEPGMKIVEDTIIADFVDEELMLQYAKQFAVVGVVTDQTDLPVRTVAYVSEKLGLPGIGYETACLFTDKFKMREKCREIGVDTLAYQLVDSFDEAREFFKNIGKPVILKPINNQGSKGVYKATTLSELEEKYQEATRYARGEKILLEEFVTGEEELVIEGIALDGWCENLICGDTYYFDISDVFSARQRIFPSVKRQDIVEKALSLNKKIIEGFGLSRGLTHGEYIISDDKVYLIEIAARGAGVYISSDIVPLMTGLDTTSFIIDIATKEKVERPQITHNNKVVCYTAFFLPEGEVKSISGVEEVVSQTYVHHNNLTLLNVGQKIKKNTDKTSRFFMVLEADSMQEMNDRIAFIQHTLKAKVITEKGITENIIWN